MNAVQLLWSFDGRIGRIAYAAGSLLNLILMFIALAIVTHGTLGSRGAFSMMLGSTLPLIIMMALCCWAQLALAAKRLQDLGINGLFSLLLLIHVVGMIVIVALLIPPGEDNDNLYGPGAPSTRSSASAHLSRDRPVYGNQEGHSHEPTHAALVV
jgi:uncharacterized membrane protein YhaH (DUF805 family)